jgi:hypothetical protein
MAVGGGVEGRVSISDLGSGASPVHDLGDGGDHVTLELGRTHLGMTRLVG